MRNEMLYPLLCTLIFSIATAFFICLANCAKHSINNIKNEQKKWNNILQQASRIIESTRSVDDLKKKIGILRTCFNRLDDQKIIASSWREKLVPRMRLKCLNQNFAILSPINQISIGKNPNKKSVARSGGGYYG